MASSTLFNRDLFQSFFGEGPIFYSILDEKVDELYSPEGARLNYQDGADTDISIDCRGVAKEVAGVWHLFVRSIETTHRIKEEPLFSGPTVVSSFTIIGYDFYKGEDSKVIFQKWDENIRPEFDTHTQPPKELNQNNVPRFLEGMKNHEPELASKAADPIIPEELTLHSSLREFFREAPELIPEQTRAMPEEFPWIKATLGVAFVVFLALAAAWKQDYLGFTRKSH